MSSHTVYAYFHAVHAVCPPILYMLVVMLCMLYVRAYCILCSCCAFCMSLHTVYACCHAVHAVCHRIRTVYVYCHAVHAVRPRILYTFLEGMLRMLYVSAYYVCIGGMLCILCASRILLYMPREHLVHAVCPRILL
jgi:hypothetical protein